MRKLFSSLALPLFLLSSFIGFSQVAPALSCEEATLMCDMSILDGFMSTMPDNHPSEPSTLCPGNNPAGGSHNISWFAFVAGTTDVTLHITPSNCNGSFPGIQFGVYTDCTFDEWVVCDASCNDDPAGFDIIMTDLTIGDDYFIFLDGCLGSICDYEVEVVSGGQFMELDEPDGVICNGECPDSPDPTIVYEICQGATGIQFIVDGFDLSIEYNWTMTDLSDGSPVSDDMIMGPNDISYTFLDLGVFEICVQANNGCDNTEIYCTTIEVVPYPSEIFDDLFVCTNILEEGVTPDEPMDPNGDGIDGWQGPDIDMPSFPDTVYYEASTDIGCLYQQKVVVNELLLPDIVYIDTAICFPGGSVIIGGTNFTFEEIDYTFVAETAAANSCDSTINVNVYEIEYILEILEGKCGPDGVQLELVIVEEGSGLGLETNDWWWTMDTGGGPQPIAGSENQLIIFADPNMNATYSVEFTRSLYGVDCFTSISEDVLLIDHQPYILPDADEWPSLICEGEVDNVVYTLDISDYCFPDDLIFTWQVTGGTIFFGEGTEQIAIDFTGSTTGEVCYQVENTCALFDGGCTTVTLTDNPVPTIEPIADPCVGDEVLITATPINPYQSIDWDFGTDAVIVSGMDPGPFTVQWTSAGPKTISVEIDYGCEFPVSHTIEIEVIEDPEITGLACLGSGGNLAIDWDDLFGITDYNITVVQGTGGMLNGSQYVFEDLMAGDIVEIQIMADGLCGPIVADTFCIVPECPDVNLVLIEDLGNDSLCLDGPMLIDFDVQETMGVAGSGLFSGTGINPISGIFDVQQAGPGTHTITYVYTFLDGLCAKPIDTTITLIPEPDYSLLVTDDTICISDQTTINFQGDIGAFGLPAYDFGSDAVVVQDYGDGSYDVRWTSPGIKMIQSVVDIPICGPYTADAMVLVEDLTPLTLTCDESTSTVTFNWNNEIEYDSFQIIINGMIVDTIDGTTYFEDMLSEGTDVIIEVFPFSNNSCEGEAVILPCRAQNCEDPSLTVMAQNDQILVCGDLPFTPVQILAQYDASVLNGNETVTWSEPNGFVDQNGLLNPGSTPGEYTVTVEVAEDNCKFSETMNVLFEHVPDLILDANSDVICIDELWTLEYVGDDLQGYNFMWSGLPNSADPSILNSQNIDFDTPGMYSINLDASSDNCSATQTTIMVEVVDSTRTPQINCVSGVDQILLEWTVEDSDCNGMFTVLINGNVISVQDTLSYLISNLDPDETIQYEIINENENCICPQKSISGSCNTLACPVTEVNIDLPDTTLCIVDDVAQLIDFEAIYDNNVFSNFVDISWEGNGIDPVTGVFNSQDAGEGVHQIILNMADGPCTFDATREVLVEEVPNLSIQAMDTVCIDDLWIVNYDGDALDNYELEWSSDFMNITTNDENLSIDFTEPGTFNLFLDAFSPNCESSQLTKEVVVIDSVRTPQIMCEAFVDSIVISWSVEDVPCNGDFVFTIGSDSELVTGNTYTIYAQPDTEVNISITTLSECLCSEKTASINCSTLPCNVYDAEIDVEALIFCIDENAQNIPLEAFINGSIVSSGLVWSGTNIDANGNIIVDENIDEGLYTYRFEYLEGFCSYSDSVEIEFVKPVELSYGVEDPQCPGEYQGYSWIKGEFDTENNVYLLDGVEVDPSIEHELEVGQRTWTIIRKGVCTSEQSFLINAAEIVDFDLNGLEIVPHNETSEYSISASNPDAIDEIIWTFKDSTVIANSVQVMFEFYDEICAEIHFNDGCIETICREVTLEDSKLFIPNVFKPGADDENSNFSFFTNNFVKHVNYMKVYDRWGNMVFSIEDASPDDPSLSWDGKYNGGLVEQGVYVYIIDVDLFNGKKDQFYGDVTVIR